MRARRLPLCMPPFRSPAFHPFFSPSSGFAFSTPARKCCSGGEFLKVPRHVAAIRFSCSCILGLGLVAWYYVPAFSLMDVTPQVRNFYRNASSHTPVYASGLLQLLSPALMGGVPVWANDPIPRQTVAAFNYVGAVPLLMVGLVGWRDVRKPLWLVAAAAAIGALGLMFGVTPFGQLRELPGLRNIHFGNVLWYPARLSARVAGGGRIPALPEGHHEPAGMDGRRSCADGRGGVDAGGIDFRRRQPSRLSSVAGEIRPVGHHIVRGGDLSFRKRPRPHQWQSPVSSAGA